LNLNQREYGLPIAFGHDLPPTGDAYPTFMEDYRSRGTPWFTVINADNRIVFSDFHLDTDWLATELKRA
ncbi:TlpA family protein disulfide reductase, partial [Acinetobacter baumannii]